MRARWELRLRESELAAREGPMCAPCLGNAAQAVSGSKGKRRWVCRRLHPVCAHLSLLTQAHFAPSSLPRCSKRRPSCSGTIACTTEGSGCLSCWAWALWAPVSRSWTPDSAASRTRPARQVTPQASGIAALCPTAYPQPVHGQPQPAASPRIKRLPCPTPPWPALSACQPVCNTPGLPRVGWKGGGGSRSSAGP